MTHASTFYEDIFVFVLLLLAVFGMYVLLALHYHIAFGMMKNTASYDKHKSKIDKAKSYVFSVLKLGLWAGWASVCLFYVYDLYKGLSLATLFLKFGLKYLKVFGWRHSL